MQATGRPARIDDYTGVPGEMAGRMRRAGLRATVGAPITVAGATWDAVAVTTPEPTPFPPQAEAPLGDFCELLSSSVTVRCENGVARAEVRDDGCGGADPGVGSGIRGLRDRVDALGGSLAVESPAGAGTIVRAVLPRPERAH